ncbi:GNAT family N-acetyltransferase [Vibrio cholerae]|uniref:GNAT family N-acetyltransferase n=1 Tax=Vibrio cholerae TaxID=666 RepID=UPI001302BA3A|nr:GNAT family N-acetyltransferase [Vibrio cholerae]EKF9474185.1 GNAT family N-acetyltransferase [Vibrio cholerae]EKF9727841.1 GNAT family N-acetyltransferase [Vibrio cholerae]HCF7778376.1 GNAT family N-acetyltransferase [Vibrio cholerae]HCF7785459.1 GNAT family N-acetyltransferase [Vibrio cholerae]
MIETPRLLLRKFELSDIESIVELLRNPEFMVYSPTGAMSYEQAIIRFQEMLDAYEIHGIGKFALVEKSTGELIGYSGLENFSYQGKNVVELGYRIRPQSRGYGYAVEASSAVLDYAKQIGYSSVLALTEPENGQSQHILKKLGFEPCGKGVFENMSVDYFEKCI